MKKFLPALLLAVGLATGLSVRASAQDLTTLLSKFLTDLYAGKITVPNAGTVTLTGSSAPAFAGAQTWNNAATTFIGMSLTITDTASAAGALAFQILCGAAAATDCLSVTKAGNLTFAGSLTAGGGGAGDFTASSTGSFGGVSRSVFATPANGEMNVINSAGTANSGLRYAHVVEANTGAKAVAATECGEVYTNTGDTDGSSVVLPDNPTAGCFVIVATTAAQTITITPSSGESLRSGTSTCGTSITMDAVASNVTIMAVTGGSGAIWAVIAVAGTATCNA